MKMEGIVKPLRALNPYPANIFLDKTQKDWKKLENALRKAGLTPDGFFGCWGRKVWNDCCDVLEELMKKDKEGEE